jgi:hypothetical protein
MSPKAVLDFLNLPCEDIPAEAITLQLCIGLSHCVFHLSDVIPLATSKFLMFSIPGWFTLMGYEFSMI